MHRIPIIVTAIPPSPNLVLHISRRAMPGAGATLADVVASSNPPSQYFFEPYVPTSRDGRADSAVGTPATSSIASSVAAVCPASSRHRDRSSTAPSSSRSSRPSWPSPQHRPLPPGDPPGRAAAAPAHRPAAHRWRGRRPALLHHALRRGREPAGPARREGECRCETPSAPARRRRGTGVRPRARRGAPRHQARQRAALAAARAGHRLRRRQGAVRGRNRTRATSPARRRPRHAGVHGAGAGRRRPALDHRADLYAWGCRPTSASRQPAVRGPAHAAQLLAAHATETPEAIIRRRPSCRRDWPGW